MGSGYLDQTHARPLYRQGGSQSIGFDSLHSRQLVVGAGSHWICWCSTPPWPMEEVPGRTFVGHEEPPEPLEVPGWWEVAIRFARSW